MALPASPLAHDAFWRRFLAHRLAAASAIVLATLVLLSLLAPLLAWSMGHAADSVDLLARFAPSSRAHPLGTDELGRDVLIRLLRGGQASLFVGLAAALAAGMLGTLVGILAGYYGGRLDAILMRIVDGVIALPLLPVLIVLAAVDLTKLGLPSSLAQSGEADLYRIVAIIALFGWTTVARHTLVVSAHHGKVWLIAATLGSADSFTDMTRILDLGFRLHKS